MTRYRKSLASLVAIAIGSVLSFAGPVPSSTPGTSVHSGAANAIVSDGVHAVIVWWKPPENYVLEWSSDLVNWTPFARGSLNGYKGPVVLSVVGYGELQPAKYWRILETLPPA